MRSLSYHDYLKTDEWHARRSMMIRFARGRCQLCNGPGPFQVHHRRYRDEHDVSILGNEHVSDLVCLCAACHETFHRERSLFTDKQSSR